MTAPITPLLKLPAAVFLLGSLACAMPVIVPTAVPLPSPTPTWTLLPEATALPAATATPDPAPSATGTEPAGPSPTGTTAAFTCPNAPEPRVQVGDTAQVTFTDGLPLRIRESPEVADDNVVTQITEGSVFTIISGPVCASLAEGGSAFVFWEIELAASGLTGWVAEGDETAYYIETIP